MKKIFSCGVLICEPLAPLWQKSELPPSWDFQPYGSSIYNCVKQFQFNLSAVKKTSAKKLSRTSLESFDREDRGHLLQQLDLPHRGHRLAPVTERPFLGELSFNPQSFVIYFSYNQTIFNEDFSFSKLFSITIFPSLPHCVHTNAGAVRFLIPILFYALFSI